MKLVLIVQNDESMSIWRNEYHPVYDKENQRCIGYINVPVTIQCKIETNRKSHLQRVCNCLSPGNILFP